MDEKAFVAFDVFGVVGVEVDGMGVVREGAEVEEERLVGGEVEGEVRLLSGVWYAGWLQDDDM